MATPSRVISLIYDYLAPFIQQEDGGGQVV